MSVKEHYDKHLGNFYSWVIGDFESNWPEFQQFLIKNSLFPTSSKIAIDLGAGHGLQSVPLAHMGFDTKSIDFNPQLLRELKNNSNGLKIEIINDDIRTIQNYIDLKPELIVCWGDTLTHLDSKRDIEAFIADTCTTLVNGGKLVLSFRDYSNELTGNDRFILVKSDNTKILTCFLEYETDFVFVTDLLYENTDTGWRQKVGTYKKVRLSPNDVLDTLGLNGMKVLFNKLVNKFVTMIAEKT